MWRTYDNSWTNFYKWKKEIIICKSKREKIEKLKAEMNKAVAAQEFEQAAVIRDKIKELENK